MIYWNKKAVVCQLPLVSSIQWTKFYRAKRWKKIQRHIKISVKKVNCKSSCICQASSGTTTFAIVFCISYVIGIRYSQWLWMVLRGKIFLYTKNLDTNFVILFSVSDMFSRGWQMNIFVLWVKCLGSCVQLVMRQRRY